MAKCKRMEDGGLSFAEMSDEDRASSAKAAIEALNARQAKASEEAGGMSEMKETPVKRMAKAIAEAKPKSEPKTERKTEVKTEAPRAERAPASVKPEPITGPKPAKSAESAMPDVAARKAATAERMSKSRSGKLGTQGVYGMKAGGVTSSASRRADGCAVRGKTKGRMV